MPSNTFIQLIDKISIQPNEASAISHVIKTYDEKSKMILAFANAHAFNMANAKRDFLEALFKSDVLYRDGVGVEILSKVLKREPGFNLNGTDFIPKLLEAISSGKKIVIFGTKKNIIETAIPKIEQYGGQVVTYEDGFQSEQSYIEIVKQQEADIYILAMGMPKQEKVALEIRDSITSGIIICGGAIVDFLGGKVRRAPDIFIKLKLEWAYRLAIEPKRMFKRYVIGNFVFLYNANKCRLKR